MPATEPTHALLVLGGEDPLHRPRSRTALHYYLACRARGQAPPCLVLSGAGESSGGAVATAPGHSVAPTEAAAMADYLVARGVAPAHLLQEPLARNTLANVVLGGALATRHGLQRVLLVSDDFHLWRALRLYERVWGRAPAAWLASGERGSAYLRLREKAVFALQTGALQLAGVAPGNWRAHLAFVHAVAQPTRTMP
ncbi:MAG: YdcF family protein [Simplicispira sp.]|nr:YdcF family protein [Simplicispira sp.]